MISHRRIQGFTLIEVLLSIVIIGAALVALSAVLTQTTDRNIAMESSNISILLGRETMSQVMARDFDDINDVPSTSYGGDFSGYSFTVSVDDVESDDLNTPVVGPTDYKRVIVSVQRMGSTVSLYNLKVKL